MNGSTVLSLKKDKKIIKINPESPFFKITHIEILENVETKDKKKGFTFRNVTLTLNQKGEKDNSWNGWTFFYGESLMDFPANGIVPFDDIVVESDKFNRVELVYNNTTNDDLEIRVHYTTINNNVSLTNPYKEFNVHIGKKDNVKILFSGPFGQGKTTFLNHFFEENEKEYNVFKVFPVNYSISHNEDVFKYIKCEILFQLLGKDVEFDKVDFSYMDTLPEFIKENPFKILGPFSKMLPKTARSIFEISESIYKLSKEIEKHKLNLEIDDKKAAEGFIKELYEQEGSIFEDNFYTQLIRQLLKSLSEKSRKKNVLIIEDLDRMDPDHIFRILNVFAAHFDDPDKNDGYTNKFGFDKIIIVADFYNVKNIFEYRYGSKVRFDGYMNKYFSRHPFFYNNKAAIAVLINDIKKGFSQNKKYAGVELFMCVLADLVATDNVTLRDLVKLLKEEAHPIIFGRQQRANQRGKDFFGSCVCFNLIYYLNGIFDSDSLLQKFQECKDVLDSNSNWNYNALSALGLPSLVLNNSVEGAFNLNFNGVVLDFHVFQKYFPEDQYLYYEADVIKNASQQNVNYVFRRSDFYDILILNLKRYEKMGGFE